MGANSVDISVTRKLFLTLNLCKVNIIPELFAVRKFYASVSSSGKTFGIICCELFSARSFQPWILYHGKSFFCFFWKWKKLFYLSCVARKSKWIDEGNHEESSFWKDLEMDRKWFLLGGNDSFFVHLRVHSKANNWIKMNATNAQSPVN